jgi:AraC-like DNA-binding protein
MHYQTHIPTPPLDRYVERLWLCSDTPQVARERIVPSGTMELVINLCEDEIRVYDAVRSDRCLRRPGGVISGPYHSFFVIDPRQHAAIIGVHFRPGGAYPFLGIPAHELADTHLDLADVWGAAAVRLRDCLCAASSSGERFSLLEAALLSRLRAAWEPHWAVRAALESFEREEGAVRVRDLARYLGLSQRRLIQVFAAEVGLTPKQYGRVRRFQRVRELSGSMVAPDWAELSCACGYADQSHLIRDFQAFAGHSPAAYQRRASEQLLPNHVPQAR